MNQNAPKHPHRLTSTEALTIRRWTIGLLTASTVFILASIVFDGSTDRLACLLSAATLCTGAIVVTGPRGFKAILAAAAIGSIVVSLMA